MPKKVLTGAALRQAIREEIERQTGGSLRPAPPQWACPNCPESFFYQVEFLAHDLAAHQDERIARAEARLRGRAIRLDVASKLKGWA